ncbi:MAG: hypothetical protein ACK55I_09020, partial [bacterium]
AGSRDASAVWTACPGTARPRTRRQLDGPQDGTAADGRRPAGRLLHHGREHGHGTAVQRADHRHV